MQINFIAGGDFIPAKEWKVYVHVNNVNGKRYVGVTSKQNPEHRWSHGRGYKENSHFRDAIDKYGWDNFDHIILFDGLSEVQAKNKEIELIAKWKTNDRNFGYNMTAGGDGTKGYYPSAETRAKLSKARLKENLSEETLRRRSEGLKGRVFSEEHKRRIGDGNSKAVEMFSKDGEYIRRFRSASDAELEMGISHSHISQCCNNKRKSTGGYLWRFAQAA